MANELFPSECEDRPKENPQWVHVTPVMAEQFLAKMGHNRPVKQRWVDQICRDILDRRFICTNGSIAFDAKGRLIDGQHRCYAIIKAGRGVWIVVVYGLPEIALPYIDGGDPRKLAQKIGIVDPQGGKAADEAHTVSLRLLFAYRRGELGSRRAGYYPTTGELLEIKKINPGITDGLAFARAYNWRMLGIGNGVVGFIHFALSEHDPTLAHGFLDAVANGESLREGDVEYELRRVLLTARTERRRLAAHVACAYFFKAWNAIRKGKKIKQFRLSRAEKYPELR